MGLPSAAAAECIARVLPARDLCAISQTCHFWNDICSREEPWRTLCNDAGIRPSSQPSPAAAKPQQWKRLLLNHRALSCHIDACRRSAATRGAASPIGRRSQQEILAFEAVELGFVDVLESILASCGSPSTAGKLAASLLFAAASKGKPDAVKCVLQCAPRSAAFADENGATALHVAASRDVVLALLKSGASDTATTTAGALPIHTAAGAGNTEVVRCLLNNSSVAARTLSGDTALAVACFTGCLSVVKLLVNVGSDLRSKNVNGMMPIHCAAVNGHTEVVEFLIGRGSPIGIVDNHGNSPIDLAAAQGHLSLIELLLKSAKKVFSLDAIRALPKEKIGSGAFGNVYKATMDGKYVALKEVRAKALQDAGKTPEWIRRKFLTEVALMHKLGSNPNFVNLIGASIAPPDDFWIVLEYVPGGSLFDLVHGVKKVAVMPLVNGIARGIAEGMAHLHSQVPQIIHRDLTSANVLLDASGSIKIADFGISRFKLELGECTMTYIGNPRWRAPEVTRGEHYSSAVDVYAFGVIVWELVSGKMPFQELDGALACLEAAKGKRPEIPPTCPPQWADLIRACWDQDQSRRPSFEAIRHTVQSLPPLRVVFGRSEIEMAGFDSY